MINPLYGLYFLPVPEVNLTKYCQQIEQQMKNLRTQCQRLTKQNEQLKISNIPILKKSTKLERSVNNFILDKGITKRKRRHRRRSLDSLQKPFRCLFKNCQKYYASQLALNLHMRIKHNGGTKTQRQILAKQIILAEERGISPPQIYINFPPDFVNEYKKELREHL